MGGVNAVKRASLEDLQALSFLPDAVARAVHTRFHDGARPSDPRPDPLVDPESDQRLV
jgi:hypothetical protein